MVFQSYALFNHMTVAENIKFGLEVGPGGRATPRAPALAWPASGAGRPRASPRRRRPLRCRGRPMTPAARALSLHGPGCTPGRRCAG
jgi:hypothetical protein